MPDTTPRLGLPWLMPAQAGKHVTVNEALGRLDAITAASVESRQTASQPASVAEGAAYILPAAPSGADWDDFFEADLAYFQDGAWRRIAARAGLTAFVIDEGALVMFDGVQWVAFSEAVTALSDLTALGVGTAPDAANPFAAKLNSTLWTARYTGEGGTGDLRYTLNKQAPGHTASLLFQSNWSGRAELGLSGSDDFAVKVSADGSVWTTAITAAGDGSGVEVPALGIGAAPQVALDVAGDTVRLRQARTPASATAQGAPGEICWDGGHVYVCVAADTWKRAALSAW